MRKCLYSIANAARCRWPTPVTAAVVNRVVGISSEAVTSSSNNRRGRPWAADRALCLADCDVGGMHVFYCGLRRGNDTGKSVSESPGMPKVQELVLRSEATPIDAVIRGRTSRSSSRIFLMSWRRLSTLAWRRASVATKCRWATPAAAIAKQADGWSCGTVNSSAEIRGRRSWAGDRNLCLADCLTAGMLQHENPRDLSKWNNHCNTPRTQWPCLISMNVTVYYS